MRLAGEYVTFHLSPEGQEALSGLLPLRFRAFVVEEDELGFWIWKPAEEKTVPTEDRPEARRWVPVILLKRQYFSTAVLDIEPEVAAGPL